METLVFLWLSAKDMLIWFGWSVLAFAIVVVIPAWLYERRKRKDHAVKV